MPGGALGVLQCLGCTLTNFPCKLHTHCTYDCHSMVW